MLPRVLTAKLGTGSVCGAGEAVSKLYVLALTCTPATILTLTSPLIQTKTTPHNDGCNYGVEEVVSYDSDYYILICPAKDC